MTVDVNRAAGAESSPYVYMCKIQNYYSARIETSLINHCNTAKK